MAVGGDLVVNKIAEEGRKEREPAVEFPLSADEPVGAEDCARANPKLTICGAPIFYHDEAVSFFERLLRTDEKVASSFSSKRGEGETTLWIIEDDVANGANAKRTFIIEEEKMLRLFLQWIPGDALFSEYQISLLNQALPLQSIFRCRS